MAQAMPTAQRIRLLEADPDIGRYLTDEEEADAALLTVPGVELPPGPLDPTSLLERHGCFGAFVVEGMLVCDLRVGEQPGMRILGPGDVLSLGSAPTSMLLVERGCRAVVATQLAMLGRDLLVGAHRWPRLIAGLHARTAEQVERVAVQLAICQLPRVEDRLLALFWLLAESWGRVTPAGTTLPLALTHGTLGALVGARRPTVTLALRELAERGAVLRQDRTWLLVERPPVPHGTAEEIHAPEIVRPDASVWARRVPADQRARREHDEMSATVQRLHAEHAASADLTQLGVQRLRESRARSRQLRETVRESRRLRRPPAPSSG
jgi:hypothetical protein